MVVAALVYAIAVRQTSTPSVFFVRNDSIYRRVSGTDSLVLRHASGPAPSPDGKRLAFIRNGDLYVYDLVHDTTHRCSHLAEKAEKTPEHDTYPSWDRDSSYVIFAHLDRYDSVRRGETVHPMFGIDHTTKSIWNVYWCWARRMAVAPDLSLFLANETAGISDFSLSSSASASFAPDGRHVAFCRNGDLWMATFDPATIHDAIREASWDEARVLACGIQEGGTRSSTETSWIFRTAWSPDSKLLAVSTDRYAAGGSPQVLVVHSDRPSEKVAAFPGIDACFLDSGHVLYVKPYSQSQDVWLRDLDSHDERILVAHATEPAVGR